MGATPFDYAEAAVLGLGEGDVLRDTYEKFFSALEQRFQQTANAGGVVLPPREIFLSPEDFLVRASAERRVQLEELGASGSLFLVRGQPPEKFHGRIKEMVAAGGQSHEAGRDGILL